MSLARHNPSHLGFGAAPAPPDLAWRARPFLYNPAMALVVFLRGVNVGGHRTFRPSVFARELSDYGVVNVGAAGTFVVHKPGPQAKFRAELRRKLPFETEVVLCDGRDLIRLEMENPFGASRAGIVRFVSILSKAGRGLISTPLTRASTGSEGEAASVEEEPLEHPDRAAASNSDAAVAASIVERRRGLARGRKSRESMTWSLLWQPSVAPESCLWSPAWQPSYRPILTRT